MLKSAQHFSTIVLLRYITRRRKIQLLILCVITFFSSLLEVFSIGAVFPFVSVFINPEIVFDNQYIQPFLHYFEILEPNQIYFPITLGFFLLTTVSYTLKSLLIFLRSILSRLIIQEVSSLMYWKITNESYQFHSNNNSGDIITALTQSFGVASKLFLPVLKIINSSLIIFFALLGVVLYRPWTALIILGGLSVFYLTVGVLMNKKLKQHSRIQNENYAKLIKLIQESLGAIKMIILNQTQGIFYKNYKRVTSEYLRAISRVEFIGQLPKLIFEYLIILFIIAIVYNYSNEESITVLVPLIITFVITIQKLLPEVNVLYTSIVNLKSNKAAVERVINFLSVNEKSPWDTSLGFENIQFEKTLELNNLNYSYDKKEKPVFTNINLAFKRGEIIGIIGDSGSGKSTLVDILSGLIPPDSGRILIDGKELSEKNIQGWKDKISVVSQNIFLFDTTIEHNISFNNSGEQIDYDRLNKVCEIAELNDFIAQQKEGLKSKIGEKGVKISGGQIQRIGIARALYDPPEILILDEATSALDQTTEKKVIEKIVEFMAGKTIIMIAHRYKSLSKCDVIYKVAEKEVIELKYKELL